MYTYVYITEQHDARASRARGDVLLGRGPICVQRHTHLLRYIVEQHDAKSVLSAWPRAARKRTYMCTHTYTLLRYM
jgi:hypothetical protein